jgi:hypothetical protein
MNRVNLDAMIPRADFAVLGDEYTLDLFQNFPISNLEKGSPILGLLRKPDFQRETNHWSPDQLVTFVASFLDNELIPSLILWKSPTHIFVIDGGHRLGALRAWMEDDYGDGWISRAFYGGEVSETQKKIAKKTRIAVERKIGRFTTLKGIMNNNSNALVTDAQVKRARNLFTRGLNLQWVQGTASVAETSFFKINSQGTPLDDTEEMLLKNRRKPIAIGARAIVRAGYGHKYWSSFPEDNQRTIEQLAQELYNTLFEPEVDQPIKTLDLPLAGSSSPVEALSILVEFLAICYPKPGLQNTGHLALDNSTAADEKPVSPNAQREIGAYDDDVDGTATIRALKKALNVAGRLTGNGNGSLGLHPAVFFYNERGKHSRFLFLGMAMLLSEKLANNDSQFFKKFTRTRRAVEDFLIENKSLIGLLLQNMNKTFRVSKMRDLLALLVSEYFAERNVTIEEAIEHLGARGRILDIKTTASTTFFTDDTKSAIFLKRAIDSALRCPVCDGLLDPAKSVSYDHLTRVREGGRGEAENGQLAHPYCNQSIKC